LKEYGNHVQILTKDDGSRDFDLLDKGDWYGVTISSDWNISLGVEPDAVNTRLRLADLEMASKKGIHTLGIVRAGS